jgi:hypothetical protein
MASALSLQTTQSLAPCSTVLSSRGAIANLLLFGSRRRCPVNIFSHGLEEHQ